MKKIVFTIQRMDGFGGAQRVMASLANRFVAAGYEVCVVALRGNESVYPLHPAVGLEHVTDQTCHSKQPTEKLRKTQTLKRLVLRHHPDVVVAFDSDLSILTLFALWGVRVPVVVCERNHPAVYPKRRILRGVRSVLYPKAAGFVFQTQQAQDFFPPSFVSRSAVIPNPIREDLPVPVNGQREKVILAAGRLTEQKNYPMMISGFARIASSFPSYTLKIYGEGLQRQTLEALVSHLGLLQRVLLLPPTRDLAGEMQKAALFLLTSDYEGIPNVLMEAMAMGLPCIATDCPIGGVRLLIRPGEDGILVPVGDEEALASQMEALLRDGERMRILGSRAAEIHDRFGMDQIFSQWETFLTERAAH